MNKKVRLLIWILMTIVILVGISIAYAKLRPKVLATKQPTQTTKQSDSSNTSSSNDKSDEKQIVPDFTLKDLKGNNVKLSDYRGKIVILNFWAVWCKYCKQEMPDLNELNKTLKKDNNIVILEVDVQEDINTVKNYLKENKISMNVVLDSDGAVTEEYGITGFPTTFIVNKDGSLYTYIPGLTDKETLLGIINKIK